MISKDLRNAYRMTFFDEKNPFGMTVFADLIERSGLFFDIFTAPSDKRPDHKNDNAYALGRESVLIEILEIMGISGNDIEGQQMKRVAEALSTVLPVGIIEQTKAEGEE